MYTEFGRFWHSLTNESQLRWIGPEKGVVHLATAAIINALWDLWGKLEGKPVWKLLADMTPEEIISLIDFTHLSDLLTERDALEILSRNVSTRSSREQQLKKSGIKIILLQAHFSIVYCLKSLLQQSVHPLLRLSLLHHIHWMAGVQ